MKTLAALTSFAFYLFTGSPAAAHDGEILPAQQFNIIYQKVYVLPQQIFFSDKGIFVQSEGQLIKIQALFSDAGGIYYTVEQDWICPRCGENNDGPSSICNICKWPLWDDHSIKKN